MIRKKSWFVLFFSLAVVSFLRSQDVVELAKKEKERRAAFKGPRIVVTNEDLGKLKKKPAITVIEQDYAAGETRPENSNPAQEEGSALAEEGQAESQPSIAGEQAAPPSNSESNISDQEFQRQKAGLEERWNSAQERVDLLTLKMNALWQEFYSLDDMKSRDSIQQQISETYSKLLKAQEEATRAKEELDSFMATSPREGVPSLWIK